MVPAPIDTGWIVWSGANTPALGACRISGTGFISNNVPNGGNNYSNNFMEIGNSSYTLQTSSIDNSINFDDLLSDIDIGDVLQFRNLTDPNNTSEQFNVMILRNDGFTPVPGWGTGAGYHSYYYQLMNGKSSAIIVDQTNQSSYELYRIIKYNKPYIELSPFGSNISLNDFNTYMTVTGSAWSISKDIPHEQYIESQYLTGSGVGALIPENYDPKLREQLPDIINKTGIDINSLT
jgi:hypothetical protein